MITDAQLIEQYVKLRAYVQERKKVHEEELRPYQEGMDTIENAFLARLNERGADNTKTDAGTAYKTTLMNTKVTARDEVLKFCTEHWSTVGSEMLQVGVVKDAVKNYVDANGKPPPGVDISYFTKVNVRKS